MINVIITPGAENISILKFVPALRGRGIETRVNVQPIPNAVNINFRNSIFVDAGTEMMNTPDAIRGASNKESFRVRLFNTVPSIAPKVFPLRSGRFLQLPPKEEFPLVVRPETHSQGRNFYVAQNQLQLFNLVQEHPNLSHAIEVIYPNREFRVFCGRRYDGTLLVWKTIEKVPTFENTGRLSRDIRPKNFSRGNAVFKLVADFVYKERIKEAALDAFRMSSLHFGAVDVLFDTQRNIPFVIEINTRFALESETTISCFVKYLFKYHKDWEKDNE